MMKGVVRTFGRAFRLRYSAMSAALPSTALGRRSGIVPERTDNVSIHVIRMLRSGTETTKSTRASDLLEPKRRYGFMVDAHPFSSHQSRRVSLAMLYNHSGGLPPPVPSFPSSLLAKRLYTGAYTSTTSSLGLSIKVLPSGSLSRTTPPKSRLAQSKLNSHGDFILVFPNPDNVLFAIINRRPFPA